LQSINELLHDILIFPVSPVVIRSFICPLFWFKGDRGRLLILIQLQKLKEKKHSSQFSKILEQISTYTQDKIKMYILYILCLL